MCGRAGSNCLRRSSPCLSWISSDISPSTGCSFLGPAGEDARSGGQWCHQAWPCAWHGVLPAASHKMSNLKVSRALQEAVSLCWSCALSWGKLMRGSPLLLLLIAAGTGGLSYAMLPGEGLQKVGNKESSDGLGWLGFFWEVFP